MNERADEGARAVREAVASVRAAVMGLTDARAIDAVLQGVAVELERPAPRRAVVGEAFARAVELAKQAAGFDGVVDAVEPAVRVVVAWLGKDFEHVSNLLRQGEIGRKFPIVVVPYDAGWPARYAEEARALRAAAGEFVGRLEHFGSTAVPGLAAKANLDMLGEVRSFEEGEREVVPRLVTIGYHYMWVSNQKPGHMMFAKGYDFSRPDDPTTLKVHLHMAPAGHPLWERLLFRDYLRQHPDAAAAYAQLKRELAARHRYDREAYTNAKAAFVRDITARARGES